MKSNLKLNILYNIFYQILILIVPLVTAPYVSRVLGSSGMGIYGYTYSVSMYFVLFSMLGVLNYGNREISQVRENKEQASKTFWGIYSVQLFMGIAMTIFYLIYVLLLSKDNQLVAALQVFYILSGVLDISWFYFGIERFRLTTTVSAINKLITTALVFLFVQSREDVYIYTLIIAIGYLSNNIIYWFMLRKYISFRPVSYQESKKHIRPLLVLFMPVIAVSVYKYMSKVMLGLMVNINEVAIFEAAEKFINLPVGVIAAIGTVMLSRITNMMAHAEKDNIRYYNYVSMLVVMFLSIGMSFGLGGIGQVFIPFFYGSDFVQSTNVLLVLLPSIMFVSWANVVRTQYLLPSKKDKFYCLSVSLGAVVNLIINLLLIPQYGAVGAAVATTITEFSVCLLQSYFSRKQMAFGSYLANVLPIFCIGILMTVGMQWLTLSSELHTVFIRIAVGGLFYLVLSLPILYKKIKKEVS